VICHSADPTKLDVGGWTDIQTDAGRRECQ
jgi:hypothetical protein